MQDLGNQPIYWDKPKSVMNFRVIVGLIATFIGLIILRDPLISIIGLALLGFSWFTDARRYLIYPNSLTIIYGRPRIKAFPFSDISHVEMLDLPMGQRVRVRLTNGSRLFISTQNIEEFRDRLDEAVGKFNDTVQPQALPEEEQDRSTPY